MFKDFYDKNRLEENTGDLEIYESILPLLNEAEEDDVEEDIPPAKTEPTTIEDLSNGPFTVTSPGLKYLFENPIGTSNSFPMPTKATEFTIVSKDEYSTIEASKKVTIIAFRLGTSSFKKVDSETVAIPPDFFTAFTTEVKKKLDPTSLALFNQYNNVKATQLQSYGATRVVPNSDALALLKALSKGGGVVSKQNGSPSPIKLYNIIIKSEDGFTYNLILDKNDEKLSIDSIFTFSAIHTGKKSYRINKRGQENEVYQIAGALFDSESMLKNLKIWIAKNKAISEDKEEFDKDEQFKPMRDAFTSVLNDSDEFGTNSDLAKKNSENFSPKDMLNALEYSASVTKFVKEVTKFKKAYIVRKSIPEYRRIEEEKLGYKDKSKHSTVDSLISDIPGGALINLLSEPSVKLEGHTGEGYVSVIKEGKPVARFYQISFKTKETDQLGRAKGLLNKKGYTAALNAADVYEESYAYDALLLAESLRGRLSIAAQNGLEVLKKLGKETFSKLVKSASVLKKWTKTIMSKMKEAIDNHVMDYCFELYGLALTENATNNGYEITEYVKKIQASGKAQQYWEKANEKILQKLKAIKDAPHAKHYRVYFNTPHTGNVTFESFVGQIYNYALLKTVEKLFLRSVDASQMEEYVESLLELYKDAIFGATALPVWVIYKLSDEGSSYKYQGTKGSIDDNKKRIVENSDTIPLTVLKGENITQGYHHFELYTLNRLVEDNGEFAPSYSKFLHKVTVPPKSEFVLLGVHNGTIAAG